MSRDDLLRPVTTFIRHHPRKLCIAAFFDGRPGHEKQTLGILQALAEMADLQVVEVVLAQLPLASRLRQLAQLLSLLPATPEPGLAGVDCFLGTGSRTHLPLLLAKQQYRRPALVCMSPAPLLRHRFDLCFVPEHDGIQESVNVMHTVGAPNCCRDLGRHREDRGLIAIGGIDAKSHRWDSLAMIAMVRTIVEQENGVNWTLTTSPRTPAVTADSLAKLARQYSHAEFRDFRKTPRGWIEAQYAESAIAWVSGDSISMLYEALSAGCRVGLLPVEWHSSRGKFQKNQELLLDKKLIVPFRRWQEGERWRATTTQLNEAQRCAERILQICQPTS